MENVRKFLNEKIDKLSSVLTYKKEDQLRFEKAANSTREEICNIEEQILYLKLALDLLKRETNEDEEEF